MLIFLCTLKMIFFQSVLEQTAVFFHSVTELIVCVCLRVLDRRATLSERWRRFVVSWPTISAPTLSGGDRACSSVNLRPGECLSVFVCDCGTVCASVFVNISVCHRCVIICCLFGCHGEIFSLLSTLSCRLKHHIRCVALNNTILFFNWQQRQSHVTHILYTKYIPINCFFIGLRAERSTNDWTLRSVEGFYCSTHISTTLGPYLEEYFVSYELLNVKMSL